jgi:integrase
MGKRQFSSHSFRAGFITTCLQAGVAAPVIQRRSGHKDESMLNLYYRVDDVSGPDYVAATGFGRNKEAA